MLRSGRDISVRPRTHNFFTIPKFITLMTLGQRGEALEFGHSVSGNQVLMIILLAACGAGFYPSMCLSRCLTTPARARLFSFC